MTDKTYVTGSIEAIFFSNPSNFYKVLLIEIDETNAEYDDFEIAWSALFPYHDFHANV